MRNLVLALALTVTALTLPAAAGAGGNENNTICVRYDNNGDTHFVFKTEPRSCTWVHRGEEPFGYTTVDMASIKWTSWGAQKARGEGKFLVNMAGPIPGRVVLSKPQAGCGGRTVFTKATFIYPRDNDRASMKLDACRSPARSNR